MHIALVTPFPSSPAAIPGGVAGVAKYLADALVQHGQKVSIIVPQVEHLAPKIVHWDHYTVYYTGGGAIGAALPGRLCALLFTRSRVHSLLEMLKPDLVHFQSTCDLSMKCSYPTVVTIHGIAERDVAHEGRRPSRLLKLWLEFQMEVRARSRVQNMIMISRYGGQILEGKINPSRQWFIPNPIAQEYFELDRRPDPMTLFSCSRLVPLKNIHGLIQAFRQVSDAVPELVLRIGGSGPSDYVGRCKSLAESLGVSKRVQFLGHLSIGQVKSELARATGLVVSSFQENSPLAIAEAMAAGVPVVATPVGGVPEMVENGRTGVLAEDTSTESIAFAIRTLLSSDLKTFSRAAQRTARERHWPAKVAQAHISAYKEVAGTARAEPGTTLAQCLTHESRLD